MVVTLYTVSLFVAPSLVRAMHTGTAPAADGMLTLDLHQRFL